MSGIQNVSVTSSTAYASLGAQGQPSLKPFANLDLTEAQRTSLRSIFANARKTGESGADVQKQIDGVLSTAQQQTLASDRASAQTANQTADSGAQTAPPTFANLNLTAAQSSSLSEILAKAQQTGESPADVQKQINAILTPAQQQKPAGDKKVAAQVAPSTAGSTSATGSTGVQNQALAGQSARLNVLLQQVLSTSDPTIS